MAYTITEAQAAELLKIADVLVGKQIKTGLIPESDRKDYIQELMLLMVQHQNDWTVPEGVRFEAYAHTVMEKRLINIWEKFHPKKDVMKEAVSLDVTFKNTDEEDEKYIDRLTYYGMMDDDTESNSILSRARTIAEVRLFVATLPQDEREFCETLMHNTKAETGRILSKGRPTMWRMIKRIRNKMIDAGFDCSQQKKYKKNPKGV